MSDQGNPGNQKRKSVEQPGKASVLTYLNSIPLRMIALVILSTLLSMVIADVAYSSLAAESYKQTAQSLANEAKTGIPSRTAILQDMQKYNLAWYYITSDDGQVRKQTEPYNPQLQAPVPSISRPVDWQGKRYFESVAAVSDQDFLHVGFYTGPILFSTFANGPLTPWPFACVLLVLCALTLLSMAVLYLSISGPLASLSNVLQDALPASALKDDAQFDEFDFLIAPTEVKRLSRVLSMVKLHMGSRGAPTAASQDEDLKQSALSIESRDRHKLGREYEELAETQSRISETYTKEMEDEFVVKLCRELETLNSSHQVCQRILDKLNDKFPTSIIYGGIFKGDRSGRFNLDSFLGFDDRNAQTLKKIDHSRIAKETFSGGRQFILNSEMMKEYGLAALNTGAGIKTSIYIPVWCDDRELGMLSVYFSTEGKVVHERLRVLRGVIDATSRILHARILAEEEEDVARTDPLTMLRNRKFYSEVVPQIISRASVEPESHPASFIFVDVDGMTNVNETYNQASGDKLLQEMSIALRSCARTSESDGKSSPGDFLIRYGGDEFLLLMENTDERRALEIAERIRWTVENKQDWPAHVKKITVSVSVAVYPNDGKNGDDLMHKCEVAVDYIKKEMHCNKVCAAQKVPKTFAAPPTNAAIEGELGVFDGSALLQSLATAQKNGILTVTAPDTRQLSIMFENGKPAMAKLGKFMGANAIVEFVTVFKEGTFNFKDVTSVDSMAKMPRFEEGSVVKKSLERCLMDGALSQDNYAAAREIIPTSEVIVRPVHAMEFSARWEALSKLPAVPTPEEFACMSDIVQRADGEVTLTSIFKALEGTPSGLMWRSASLLIHHGLVQTKPAVAV